jgi:DNA-binding response OmpR family regulator
VKELLARVQAVLRRTPGRPSDLSSIPFVGGKFDVDRGEVHFDDGQRGELSEREMELLRYLAVNYERAVSRDEIMERVWRINPRCVVETRTIDMHIARLREKLRDDSDNPQIILTVRGKGYRFAGREEALSKSGGKSG